MRGIWREEGGGRAAHRYFPVTVTQEEQDRMLLGAAFLSMRLPALLSLCHIDASADHIRREPVRVCLEIDRELCLSNHFCCCCCCWRCSAHYLVHLCLVPNGYYPCTSPSHSFPPCPSMSHLPLHVCVRPKFKTSPLTLPSCLPGRPGQGVSGVYLEGRKQGRAGQERSRMGWGEFLVLIHLAQHALCM